jgi:hypothetical protein
MSGGEETALLLSHTPSEAACELIVFLAFPLPVSLIEVGVSVCTSVCVLRRGVLSTEVPRVAVGLV